MEFVGRCNNKGKGKANESYVTCYCGLPAKISQSWTDKNPGRKFYVCVKYKSETGCRFFLWLDEGEAFGWQKKALIEARDKILPKDKTIMELKNTISKLQNSLAKNTEVEEDIINAFLKL